MEPEDSAVITPTERTDEPVRRDRRVALVAGLAAIAAAACQPIRPPVRLPSVRPRSTTPPRPVTNTTTIPRTTTAPRPVTTTTVPRPTTTVPRPVTSTTTTTTTTTPRPPPTTSPAPQPIAPPSVVAAPPHHVARRLTYGPTPELIAEITTSSSVAWIDAQLNAPGAVDADLEDRIRFLYPYSRGTAYDLTSRAEPWRIAYELPAATLIRATCAQRQIFEKTVAFFWDHFSVDVTNDRCQYQCADYDEKVIRPNAFGRFSDLLMAVAKSGAMLGYLNQATSQARGGRVPNENFARELMELHTVGSDAGYSESDVTAVAYLLSGWSLPHPYGTFTFISGYHSLGEFTDPQRTVLGWRRGTLTGLAAGESFINHLARHPATALRLAHSLAIRFIGEHIQPNDLVVQQAAAAYRNNDTAIVPMLRVLLTSAEFADAEHRRIRRPAELMTAMLRVVAGSTRQIANPDEAESAKWMFSSLLLPLSQLPHWWPDPNGYSDADESWMNVGALITRWNMATSIAGGSIPGFRLNVAEVAQWSDGPTMGDWLTEAARRCDVTLDRQTSDRYLSQVWRQADDLKAGLNEQWVYSRLLTMLFQTAEFQTH